MQSIGKSIIAMAMLLVVTACSSDINAYAPATDNIVAARALRDSGASTIGIVTSSSAKPQNWISCRGISVGMSDETTFHEYIAKALKDELRLAELIDEDGQHQISVHLKKLGFSSWEGTWHLVTDVRVDDGVPFEVDGFHNHDAAWTAVQECENASGNFVFAVQDLIGNIMSHPDFAAALAQQSSAP